MLFSFRFFAGCPVVSTAPVTSFPGAGLSADGISAVGNVPEAARQKSGFQWLYDQVVACRRGGKEAGPGCKSTNLCSVFPLKKRALEGADKSTGHDLSEKETAQLPCPERIKPEDDGSASFVVPGDGSPAQGRELTDTRDGTAGGQPPENREIILEQPLSSGIARERGQEEAQHRSPLSGDDVRAKTTGLKTLRIGPDEAISMDLLYSPDLDRGLRTEGHKAVVRQRPGAGPWPSVWIQDRLCQLGMTRERAHAQLLSAARGATRGALDITLRLADKHALLNDEGRISSVPPECLRSWLLDGQFFSADMDAYAMDSWILGCALYQMAFGTQLFNIDAPVRREAVEVLLEHQENRSFLEQMVDGNLKIVRRKNAQAMSEKQAGDIKTLLMGLLECDPTRRMTIGQLLEHPFLRDAVARVEAAPNKAR